MTREENADAMVDQALALYQEKLKPILEPGENGKAVAVHVPTGDYAIGRSHREARRAMEGRHDGNGLVVSMTIGPPTTEDLDMAAHFSHGRRFTEKELIEMGTAEGFLEIYNEQYGTDFQIIQIADSPDVRCRNSCGNILNLEITLTEDEAGDIPAVLGRSEKHSLENLRRNLERVQLGKEAPKFSALQRAGDVLIGKIQNKLLKDYGRNAALVVRDSSPLEWDWEIQIPSVFNALNLNRNPFDMGIWLLSYDKERLFQIVEPSHRQETANAAR